MKSETKIVSSSAFWYSEEESGETLEQHCNALTLQGYTCKAVSSTFAHGRVLLTLIYERPLPDPVEPEEELRPLIPSEAERWVAGWQWQHAGLFLDSYPNARDLSRTELELMAEGWLYSQKNPHKPIPRQYRPEE